jgi:hypothetical protein
MAIVNTFTTNIFVLDEFWNCIKQTLFVFGWEWNFTTRIHLLSHYKVNGIHCFVALHVSLKGIGNTHEPCYCPRFSKIELHYLSPFLLLGRLYFQQDQQEWTILLVNSWSTCNAIQIILDIASMQQGFTNHVFLKVIRRRKGQQHGVSLFLRKGRFS